MDDLELYKAIVRETRSVSSDPASIAAAVQKVRSLFVPAPVVVDDVPPARSEKRSRDRMERNAPDRSGE